MANYETLKTAIRQVVKINGNNEITGALLQQSLLAMINTLGAGYQFMGVATPTTNPGTIDQKAFYIAATAGDYSNFGSISLDNYEIAVLVYSNSWTKNSVYTGAKINFARIIQYNGNPSSFITITTVSNTATDGFSIQFPDVSVVTKEGGYSIPVAGVLLRSSGKYVYYVVINNFTNEFSIKSLSQVQRDESIICVICPGANCPVVGLDRYKYNGVEYAPFNLPMFNNWVGIDTGRIFGQNEDLSRLLEFTWDGTTQGRVSVKVPINAELEYSNGSYLFSKTIIVNHTGGYYNFVLFNKTTHDITIVNTMGMYYDYNYCVIAVINNYSGHTPAVWTLSSIYKYNGVIYRPFNDSIVNALNTKIAEIGNNIVIGNGNKGLTFPTDVPDNVGNAIRRVWIGCQTAGNIEKMLENLDSPLFYIYKINNTPGTYSPYIGISHVDTSDDQSFTWFLTSQTQPRTGIEVIGAMISTALFNQLGLTGYRIYIYIEIDWDIFGASVQYSPKIQINLSQMNRFSIPLVKLNDIGDSLSSNSLYGKNIVCFGDSLTEMLDTSYGLHYSDYIASFTGANVINVGIGGSQLRQRTTPVDNPANNNQAYAALDVVNMVKSACEQSFTKQENAAEYLKDYANDDNTAIVERLKNIDWTKIDAVTVFAGTNDWFGSGSRMGTSGSKDVNYTLGAINTIVESILTTYPNVKIYWFTPIVRYTGNLSQTIDQTLWGDNETGTDNLTLKEFAASVVAELVLNHIPVCDMYNSLGWNLYNMTNYFQGTDGTHPRKFEGVTMLAKRIAGFILSNHTI